MNLHKNSGDPLKPCKHMEAMLNRTAEGSAPSLMRWYARSHASHCVACGGFLEHVTTLLGDLKQMKDAEGENQRLTPDEWESLESRWAEAEA